MNKKVVMMALIAISLCGKYSTTYAQEKVVGNIEVLSTGISKFFGGTMSSNPVLDAKIIYVNSGFTLGLERSSDLLDPKTLSNNWSLTGSWGNVYKGTQYSFLLFSYVWDINSKMSLIAPALSLSKRIDKAQFSILGGYGFNEMKNLYAIQGAVASSYFDFGQKVQVSYVDWTSKSWSILLEVNKNLTDHFKLSLYYTSKWTDDARNSASAIGISYLF
ncbi:MAG: hypothetical protein LBH96_00870 [Candidatus Peribacteria bacterium]|jgi:hypothetical protein|nr:hypothetical protein [Candidatus Peribacteria bacterium]